MGLFRRAATLPPGEPIDSPRRRGSAAVRTATDGRDVLMNSPDGWEVDAPWLWWLGPAGGDGTGGPFGNPLTTDADPYGVSTLPAVSLCTSLICDTISALPWRVRRGYETLPTPEWIADPQATRIDQRVVDPSQLFDVRLSAVEFWADWIRSALWFGDGYVYAPVRDVAGAPKPPLWQLHPHHVTIDGGTYWVGDIPLPVGSVIHLRGDGPYTNGHGRGVIDAHGLDLRLAATVRTYAAGVFQSGVPAGYLKSTQPNLSPTAAADLKAKWLAQHGGARRTIAILNATTEFHPISISPVDAQLTAAREWSLRDIANAFHIPPYKLGVPSDSSTYANVESRQRDFAQQALFPWTARIESTLSAELARGTDLDVVMDGLLRADSKTRADFYKLALEGGWLTVDEVRALEGLPPLATQGVT